jgi:GNAT superfamily N-acetyltransferase
MPDLIAKLYDLPDERPGQKRLKKEGIHIRKAMARDKLQVVSWVKETFGTLWAGECDIAFARQPIACFIAVKDAHILGFACHDTSMKNFFGPTGVAQNARKKGIGTALLFACLHAMAETGYAYAVIGDAGTVDFYEKTINAHVIPGSTPGPYADRLKTN